jgi:hypothetical protein
MLNKKKIGVMIASLLIFSQCAVPAFAGTWYKSKNGVYWAYKNDDGTRLLNGWVQDNGLWYHISLGLMEKGTIVTTELDDNGYSNDHNQYYVCSDGHMANGGFYDVDDSPGYMVFTDKDGHIIFGMFMVDGVLYRSGDLNGLINKGKYQNVETTFDADANIYYGVDSGKIVDKNGQPFVANAKFYSLHKNIPKYDSKGNLIGTIQN